MSVLPVFGHKRNLRLCCDGRPRRTVRESPELLKYCTSRPPTCRWHRITVICQVLRIHPLLHWTQIFFFFDLIYNLSKCQLNYSRSFSILSGKICSAYSINLPNMLFKTRWKLFFTWQDRTASSQFTQGTLTEHASYFLHHTLYTFISEEITGKASQTLWLSHRLQSFCFSSAGLVVHSKSQFLNPRAVAVILSLSILKATLKAEINDHVQAFTAGGLSTLAGLTVHPYMKWHYHIFYTREWVFFTSSIMSLDGFVLSNHYHWEEETLVPSSYGIGSLIKWAFIVSSTHPSSFSSSVCVCASAVRSSYLWSHPVMRRITLDEWIGWLIA